MVEPFELAQKVFMLSKVEALIKKAHQPDRFARLDVSFRSHIPFCLSETGHFCLIS
jgi:hypothetical protein